MARGTAICLFGGSFDPPHQTHRRLCETARARLGADVVVLPCGDHPHKGGERLAPAAHRVAMCQLAFDGLPGVSIDDRETRRREPSYTLLTLREFRAELGPGARLYWLIGADNLPLLPTWRAHHELLALAQFVTFPRAGHPIDESTLARSDFDASEREGLLAHVLDADPDTVSATEVRARLRAGRSVEDVAPEVLEYIERHALYR